MQPLKTLSAEQKYVVDSGILWSGFNCILQMPTGSGKTWLAEQAIKNLLQNGKRAVYLTPLRALATELYARWKQEFKEFDVGIFTGEFMLGGMKPPVSFDKARLLIMTPERLDSCTRNWRSHWSWMPELDAIVVDEFHLLGDPDRGPRLEGTLLRMQRLNPFLQIIGLSATLGNRTELADWLNGVHYGTNVRNIPLTWNIARYKKATEKPGLLSEEVLRCIKKGGKSLVFVQSRRRAEQLSQHLINVGLRASHHHAGLQHENRTKIEKCFRSNELDVIVATGTLEMGLNMPVRQVILYDLQTFDGSNFVPLSVTSVWQRGGRAGRPGLDESGEVVLLAPSWDHNLKTYLKGTFEPTHSGLSMARALAEQVVIEVSTGLSRTLQELKSTFSLSLASYQDKLANLPAVIETMIQSEMLIPACSDNKKKKEQKYKVTRLGRVACRHHLAPDTVLYMKNAVLSENIDSFTFLDFLLITVGSGDCDPLLPVDFEELDFLSIQLNKERSVFLKGTNIDVAKRLDRNGKQLLSIIKTALVAREWTRVGDLEEVAKIFNCYPFEIIKLSENLARLLTALSAICEDLEKAKGNKDPGFLKNKGTSSFFAKYRALIQMIAYGLDEKAASLTLIPGIGGKLTQKLINFGIEDIEDLALAEPECFSAIKGISKKRAIEWIENAESLAKQFTASCFKDNGPDILIKPPGWPAGIDPYRLRRALELNVKKLRPNIYQITGGLEPHIVKNKNDFICDCLDFENSNVCKHLLAVRIFRKDRELKALAKKLSKSKESHEGVDLFNYWFENNSFLTKRGVA